MATTEDIVKQVISTLQEQSRNTESLPQEGNAGSVGSFVALKKADNSMVQVPISVIETMINEKFNTLLNGTDPNEIDSITDLVNWVLEHGADAAEMASAIQANATAISDEKTRATTAEQTLLRKIHGDAEVSDGRIEPFVSLGKFSSVEFFVEHLDTMHSNTGAEYGKYVGAFRAMVSSSLIDVVNNTTYIAGDLWIQSVRGNFALQDGVLKLSSDKYGTFYRSHTAAGWSTWKQS